MRKISELKSKKNENIVYCVFYKEGHKLKSIWSSMNLAKEFVENDDEFYIVAYQIDDPELMGN